MNNTIFPAKLYIPNILNCVTPQNGPGNKKIISYELTLVSKCLSEQEVKKMEALYKVQGLSNYARYSVANQYNNIYEETSDILISSPLNGGMFTLIYPKEIHQEGYHSYNFYAHYIVSGKNILNPNSKNILAKRNKSLALNKKISKESELISTYSKDVIWLDRKYINKLLEKELSKYGKKLNPYVKVII